MSTRKTPRIKFSRWSPFEKIQDLSRIRGVKEPGVYLIGEFERKPKGRVDRRSKHILYVGISVDSLRKRLRKFYHSALESKKGHSGGKNCRKKFKAIKKTKDLRKRLYVAVFKVEKSRVKDKVLRDSFIKYVERNLFLSYCKKHKRLPYCNKD